MVLPRLPCADGQQSQGVGWHVCRSGGRSRRLARTGLSGQRTRDDARPFQLMASQESPEFCCGRPGDRKRDVHGCQAAPVPAHGFELRSRVEILHLLGNQVVEDRGAAHPHSASYRRHIRPTSVEGDGDLGNEEPFALERVGHRAP